MNGKQYAIALAVMALMAAAGGFAAIAVLLDPSPVQAAPDALQTRALEVVDASGKVRARLAVDANGDVALRFLDAKGTKRSEYIHEAANDRTTLDFRDAGGEQRWIASLTRENDTVLAFTGAGDEKYVTLLAGPRHASTLILKDPKTKQMVTTFAGRGQASFQLNDKNGKGGYVCSVLGDGRSVFALSKDGKLRIRGMVKEDASPQLVFLDDLRRQTWSAGK
ncbi:MAG: hypothetical protein QNJ90_10265 [Planctomycetota bacterium]|nr:hypothetical protein [Planctomycetota bacterium]